MVKPRKPGRKAPPRVHAGESVPAPGVARPAPDESTPESGADDEAVDATVAGDSRDETSPSEESVEADLAVEPAETDAGGVAGERETDDQGAASAVEEPTGSAGSEAEGAGVDDASAAGGSVAGTEERGDTSARGSASRTKRRGKKRSRSRAGVDDGKSEPEVEADREGGREDVETATAGAAVPGEGRSDETVTADEEPGEDGATAESNGEARRDEAGESGANAASDGEDVREDAGEDGADAEPRLVAGDDADLSEETGAPEDPLAAVLAAASAPRTAPAGVVLSDELPIDPDDDLRGVEGEASARLVSILESLLFSAAKPLSVKDLRKVLQETSQRQIQLALRHLIEVTSTRGVVLAQVAGGFQFRTHPENAMWVQKMLQAKPAKLSRTQIETLAIVAYRQPVTRPEIDDIRGVDSGAVLKSLLERELIQIVGKKDEPGRPLLYGTTVRFLEFFNLRGLRDLPTLRDFRDLSEESKATVRERLGDLQIAEALGQEVLGFAGPEGQVASDLAKETDGAPTDEAANAGEGGAGEAAAEAGEGGASEAAAEAGEGGAGEAAAEAGEGGDGQAGHAAHAGDEAADAGEGGTGDQAAHASDEAADVGAGDEAAYASDEAAHASDAGDQAAAHASDEPTDPDDAVAHGERSEDASEHGTRGESTDGHDERAASDDDDANPAGEVERHPTRNAPQLLDDDVVGGEAAGLGADEGARTDEEGLDTSGAEEVADTSDAGDALPNLVDEAAEGAADDKPVSGTTHDVADAIGDDVDAAEVPDTHFSDDGRAPILVDDADAPDVDMADDALDTRITDDVDDTLDTRILGDADAFDASILEDPVDALDASLQEDTDALEPGSPGDDERGSLDTSIADDTGELDPSIADETLDEASELETSLARDQDNARARTRPAAEETSDEVADPLGDDELEN